MPGLRVQRKTDKHASSPSSPRQVKLLLQELETLIKNGTWEEIRKGIYPAASAAGIRRAKERHAHRLPEMIGLGSLKTLDHFAVQLHRIQARWSNLFEDDRLKEIFDAINQELVKSGVPKFLGSALENSDDKGAFISKSWQFTISAKLIGLQSLSNDDAAEICNTMLHESRHAEQQFLAARFSAGDKKKSRVDTKSKVDTNEISKEIAIELNVDGTVADRAVVESFDDKTDPQIVLLGRQMYQADAVDKDKNQNISDDDGRADLDIRRNEAQIALTNLMANASVQNIDEATAKRNALSKQIDLVKKRYVLYRKIPYEADAHEVGDSAELAFRGWP